MERLRSYLGGRWVVGSGPATVLVDPTTEVALAEAATGGLEVGGALDHARRVGGPALRSLTFAERGALLQAMASALHEHRDELLALSTRNGGNTRSDAKFDVDGATGTLAWYARLGASLGDRRVLLDGDADALSRSPRYVGQHIKVPRAGAAVLINAFNFPAWGFGEKAATALLAGMPILVKPATSTALVCVRMVEILTERSVLPEGALSLLSGGAGDLLDHLGPGDVLSFTGSSDTAARLRTAPSVVRWSVRLNVEADSLNAAVLGPDLGPATDTFDLAIREIARDVTQKAGQKCTAIRRILVPRDRVEAVVEALADAIGSVRVGDPALKEVRMGPLCNAAQLRDVQEGVQHLARAGRFVVGDGARGALTGVDGDRGYFLSPCLLVADDPAAAVVHDREVFGPVATVLPYDGTPEHACSLVALGRGGLVSSVYTDDAGFAAGAVLGLAPHHGRVNLGSRKVAEHSMGPGTVLPQLVHGGPGRAGGGEELGGARGLDLYLQRTAVQGDRPLLEKILV